MAKASVLVWGAKCKNIVKGKVCGAPIAVRASRNFGNQLDVPSTTRITTQVCPTCKLPNQFSDAELTEGLAELPEV